jgi:hypothetical protein
MLVDDGPNDESKCLEMLGRSKTEGGSADPVQGRRGDGVGRVKWNY